MSRLLGAIPADGHAAPTPRPTAGVISDKSNVALYPQFQRYFRTHRPPLLAAWGKNDPFFLPPGAEAFKRDIPEATVRFFDTGHFAQRTRGKSRQPSVSFWRAR